MKKVLILAVAATMASLANAQVVLYNDLGDSNPYSGQADWDGGINSEGSNVGAQVGQAFTSSVTGSMTFIEGYFLGTDPNGPLATGEFVEVFNLSGGVVGTEVGSAQVTGSAINDGLDPNFGFANEYRYDVSANVDISGLVAGNQYVAVIQGQGPDMGFLGVNSDGNHDTYMRDYSNFLYGSWYNTTTWTESSGVYGFPSGDTMMKIEATPSTPEPCSLAALGLGVAALVRKRKARN